MALPALATAAIGGAATGFGGGIARLFGGGGGEGEGSSTPDYGGQAQLYLARMSPYNTYLSAITQELGTSQAPWLGALGAQQQVLAQGQYDIFDAARQKDLAEANLRLSLAQTYGLGAANTLVKDAQSRQGLELMGAGAQADIAKSYANAVYGMQNAILGGEERLKQPTATALAGAGLASLQAKNQLASKVAETNLALKLGEADTQNKLALQRGGVLGDIAKQRFNAGLAASTHAAFA